MIGVIHISPYRADDCEAEKQERNHGDDKDRFLFHAAPDENPIYASQSFIILPSIAYSTLIALNCFRVWVIGASMVA